MPDFYRSGFALLRLALFGGTAEKAEAEVVRAKAKVERAKAKVKRAKIKVKRLATTVGVTKGRARLRFREAQQEFLEARQNLVETQQNLVVTWQKSRILSNRMKAVLIGLANALFNYTSPFSGPAINPRRMREGGVRIAFSVLIDTFDEFFDDSDEDPPWPGGTPFFHLQKQMEFVEQRVTKEKFDRVWIPTRDQLNVAIEKARTGQRIALVHCVEGGYHLGDNEEDITKKVDILATRGVGYVTLAHLFFHRLATCVNALPMPDWMYHWRFPQENIGLTELGKFAVRQLAEKRILIDVCHMSERATVDTFKVLEEYDKQERSNPPTPVIATHMACRIGNSEYNLSDDTIKRIAERGGLLGVIFCRHWMRDHLKKHVDSWDDTCRIVKEHIERIRESDPELLCAAIGSDHDGFIKPTLKGLEHPGKVRARSSWIVSNYPDEAKGILSENAIRVLRQLWKQPTPRE